MYKKEKQLFQRDPHPEIRFPGRGGGGGGGGNPSGGGGGGGGGGGLGNSLWWPVREAPLERGIFLEPALGYMKG